MLEVYWNWFDDEIVVFDFCRENGVLILYRPCWKLGYQARFATTKLVSNLCNVKLFFYADELYRIPSGMTEWQ